MRILAPEAPAVKPTRRDPRERPSDPDRDRRAISPNADAPAPGAGWSLGYSATHLLTALVIERVERGDDVADSIDAVWLTTYPEFRAETLSYMRMFDPVRDFAGWTASCLVGDPLDRPGPDGDPYTPTDAELAELAEVAGWEGDGDDLPPCPDEEPDWASMYPDEEPDWASMYPDFDPHDPAERVEVLGHRAYATALA